MYHLILVLDTNYDKITDKSIKSGKILYRQFAVFKSFQTPLSREITITDRKSVRKTTILRRSNNCHIMNDI